MLNRSVGRRALFHKDGDYSAFQRVLHEAMQRTPIDLLAWFIMPNHFHLVLGPRNDGDLSEFIQWLTNTHSHRYRAHYQSAGTGHIYQGRFKSFPVQDDLGFPNGADFGGNGGFW